MPVPMSYANSMFPDQGTFDAWFWTVEAFHGLAVRVTVWEEDYPMLTAIQVDGIIDGRRHCMRYAPPLWALRAFAADLRRRWVHEVRLREGYSPYDYDVVKSWVQWHPRAEVTVNDAWGSHLRMRFGVDDVVVSPAAYHDLLRRALAFTTPTTTPTAGF